MMKIVKLEKQGDSDQHSYVISNLVVKDTNLKVTEEHSGSKKKKAVRFENMPEEVNWLNNNIDPLMIIRCFIKANCSSFASIQALKQSLLSTQLKATTRSTTSSLSQVPSWLKRVAHQTVTTTSLYI